MTSISEIGEESFAESRLRAPGSGHAASVGVMVVTGSDPGPANKPPGPGVSWSLPSLSTSELIQNFFPDLQEHLPIR